MNNIKTSEYRDMALTRLLDAISNRRLIQHLRFQLFKNVDFQPENLIELNLKNSQIEKDIYLWISTIAKEILEQLNDNVDIYKYYFMPNVVGLKENVRDLLLDNEEELFAWEIFYQEYLKKFLEDKERLAKDPVGYYQKIYEFIMLDITYNDLYESYI